MRCSGFPNEHHVQDTFVLVPTGTLDRGTPKHDAGGTVLSGSIAHLIRCSPAGEAAFIPCPEEAGPSAPEKEGICDAGARPRHAWPVAWAEPTALTTTTPRSITATARPEGASNCTGRGPPGWT